MASTILNRMKETDARIDERGDDAHDLYPDLLAHADALGEAHAAESLGDEHAGQYRADDAAHAVHGEHVERVVYLQHLFHVVGGGVAAQARNRAEQQRAHRTPRSPRPA